MARTYPVVPHTVFGGGASAAVNGIAQFGSKQAGSPNYSVNIATIQALAAWLQGWAGAVTNGKVPPLEELNAALLEPSYQIASLFECGIPDWNAGTTYSQNSFVQVNGIVYISLINTNLNNSPISSPTDWAIYTPVFGNELSPTALTSDVNDYNPTGWGSNITNLFVSTTVSSKNITGLLGGINGQVVNIINADSGAGGINIVLEMENASSLAANRFTGSSSDITLSGGTGPKTSATFIYSGTLSRWLLTCKNF